METSLPFGHLTGSDYAGFKDFRRCNEFSDNYLDKQFISIPRDFSKERIVFRRIPFAGSRTAWPG
jgi:hypothetical protein